MQHVTSRDGTPIAYRRLGNGPPIILVGAAFNDHTNLLPLAQELATGPAAITYDRRSRGASEDRAPGVEGAVEREVADLAALIDAAGSSATLLGYSSGAVLALAAAAGGLPVTGLVLFEPPFATEDNPPAAPADLPEQLADLVDQGRNGDAVELFQTRAVGLPAHMVAQIRQSPIWPTLEAMAPGLVYDAQVTRQYPYATDFTTSVTVPTLVLSGEGTWPRLQQAARSAAEALPDAEHRTVVGKDHELVPDAVAHAVRHFFDARHRAEEPA